MPNGTLNSNGADSLQQDRTENRILCCTLAAFAISGATSQPLGSFVPFLREAYGLSYRLSGILLSCQSVGNLIAVLLAGILPIYLGRRRSVLLTSVWMIMTYFVFASGLHGTFILMLACFLSGISRGGNSNFCSTMVSTLPEEKSTRGYNLLHGSYALGALLSPLLLVAFARFRPGTGWRIAAGLLSALALVQVTVYSRMPLPEEHLSRSVKTADHSFLRVREFWLASAMLLFYIATEYAIVGWMVTYFQDIGVLSADHAQFTNSLIWLFIFIGRMLGALAANRVPRTRMLVIDGIGQFIFFLIMFSSRNPAVILPALAGVGLCLATIYPSAFAFGSGCIKGNDLGCSLMIFAGSAGGIITPALVGFVAEYAGIRAGMGLVVILTGLLLVSILLSVWSSLRRNPGRTA